MLDGLKIFPAWFLVEYHVPAVQCEQSGPSCWRKEAGETQRVNPGEAPMEVFPLAHRAGRLLWAPPSPFQACGEGTGARGAKRPGFYCTEGLVILDQAIPLLGLSFLSFKMEGLK